MSFTAHIKRLCDTFRRDTSGSIVIEFALMAPIMIFIGFGGYELNNAKKYSLLNDNVATGLAQIMSVYGGLTTENQMTLLMQQAAPKISGLSDFGTNGYVVFTAVASDGKGGTKVLWQRCAGGYHMASKHSGITTTLPNGGNIGSGDSAILVESWFHYQPHASLIAFNTDFYVQRFIPNRDTPGVSNVINDGNASSSSCG